MEFFEANPLPAELMENESDEMPPAGEVPYVLFYRIIVMPVKPMMVSRGGILIPDVAREAQELFNPYGRLVAIGESAFKSRRLSVDGSPLKVLPNIGDWVHYGRGAGAKIMYAGRKFVVLNEDELICIIPDIQKVRRSV